VSFVLGEGLTNRSCSKNACGSYVITPKPSSASTAHPVIRAIRLYVFSAPISTGPTENSPALAISVSAQVGSRIDLLSLLQNACNDEGGIRLPKMSSASS
jgi:hypothetical protein